MTLPIILAWIGLILAIISFSLALLSMRLNRMLSIMRKEDTLLRQLGPQGYMDLYHTDFTMRDFSQLTWLEKQHRIWYCWWDETTNWIMGNINYDALTGRLRWYSKDRRLK